MSNCPHPDITRIDIRRRPDGVFLGIIRPAHRQYYKEFEAPTWESAAEQIRVFLCDNQLILTEVPQQ